MADIVTFEIPNRESVEFEIGELMPYWDKETLKGDKGDDGESATITIGTVTEGDTASVTNSGTSSAAVLDFVLPKGADGADGQDGADGAAATISIGTVSTGAAGSSVSVTNSGTSSAAVFNFTIPKGDTGAAGAGGQDGQDGADGVSPTLSSSKSGKTTTIYYTDKTHTSGTDVLATVLDGNDGDTFPTQAGNSGKFLTTDGSSVSWATVSAGDSLPSQTGNSGKYLTTNGSAASWADVPKEIFLIELQYNSSTQVYSSTETYAEAKAAHDAGKILAVNAFNTYMFLVNVDSGTGNNDGSLVFEYNNSASSLIANFFEDDSWDVYQIPMLPAVSSPADDGKFLRVVNGAWAAVTVPIYNGATS